MASFSMPSAATGAVVSILNNGTPPHSARHPSPTMPSDARPASALRNNGTSGSWSSAGNSKGDSTESLSIESRGGSGRTSRTPSEAATSLTSARPESDTSQSSHNQRKSYQVKVLDHAGYAESPTSQASRGPGSSGGPDDDIDGMSIASASSQGPAASESYSNGHARIDTADSASFASSSSRAKGPIVQGGKKRYPCNHPGCDKTFSTSGHAARHNRIHTGQKPYRCTFPGCEASFSRQDNALAHFRSGHALTKARSGADGDEQEAGPTGSQYDAQVGAGAELGRKALEEGTAIAIVRDGKVERTVGMPRARKASQGTTDQYTGPDDDGGFQSSSSGGRRGSASTMHTDPSQRNGPTPASEYAQAHRALPGPATRFPRGANEAKPSSIHSDHLPMSTARRTHPYAIPVSRHKSSVHSARDFTNGHHAASEDGNGPRTSMNASQDADMYAVPTARRLSHAWPQHPPSTHQPYSNARSHYHDATTSEGGVPPGYSRPVYPPADFSHPRAPASTYTTRSSPTWRPLRLEGLTHQPRHRKPSLPTPDGYGAWSWKGGATSPQSLFSSPPHKPILPCSSDRSTTLATSYRRQSCSDGRDGGEYGDSAVDGLMSLSSRGPGLSHARDEARIVLPPIRFPNPRA
ncbi:unnamed protein product [Parajaminaea phylloscopi]